MTQPSSAAAHYDEQYYREHYAQFLGDERANQLIGQFYKSSVFDRFVPAARRVLDYGCGPGHLSAAVGAVCYDPSEFARRFLRSRGRDVFENTAAIPDATFDAVLCSHALEHALYPPDELHTIRRVLAPSGRLILVLPIEKVPGKPTRTADDNRHYYCWTFQTVTNLLLECGYAVGEQEVLYGPFLLNRLGQWLNPRTAARWATVAGRWKKNYPSLLTVAITR
jgi:SAM-dependent methyltransferase